MKTAKSVFLCLLITFVCLVVEGHAALVDRGGGLVYDDILNVTWLQDANYARTTGYSLADSSGRLTWSEATTWAENMTYFDSVRNVIWTDWRLPTTINLPSSAGFDTTGVSSEMAYMYYINLGFPAQPWDGITQPRPPDPGFSSLFPNIVFRNYWSGTANELHGTQAWTFHFHFGEQSLYSQATPLFAWAVRDGDVAAVPIPGAVWLLGSGLLGLVVIRRRFRG